MLFRPWSRPSSLEGDSRKPRALGGFCPADATSVTRQHVFSNTAAFGSVYMPGMGIPGADDKALIERVRCGDAAAFEALVVRHARAAFAVALSFAANHADAEDICQDAWVRAVEHIEDCRQPEKFAFWLLQIVRNRARNFLEHRRIRAAQPLDDAFASGGPAGGDDPVRSLERQRQRVVLERAIDRLPHEQREVVLLHDLAGWKHRTIGQALGISEVLCRQRLFQARAQLRKFIENDAQR